MKIEKLVIENFKGFKDRFSISLNDGVNILVGDNEEGKTTILEAINLVLTCTINGKYLKNELTQHLFNVDTVQTYLDRLKTDKPLLPPFILIEAYLEGEDLAELEGDGNSDLIGSSGVSLMIEFDENYNGEYQTLVKEKALHSLPIEYYTVTWKSFGRKSLTSKSIPLKVAMIDSTNGRYKNASDVYINRIIKEILTNSESIGLAQAYRNMTDHFKKDISVEKINTRLTESTNISNKKVKISAEMPSRNSWEDNMVTYIDDVPFIHVGKGEQSLVKTKLALSHNKAKEASLLLVEEPENHLSHTKLNYLIKSITDNSEGKQIIVTTHSSFVANKLGLASLILIGNRQTTRLADLSQETNEFFNKISGYDTLRLVLAKKAILVEGDSDELVVQKAYLKQHGRLPIEDGIDVISVGTSFLRFLEIAKKLKKETSVVTDNDGDLDAVKKKYDSYLKEKNGPIKICFEETVEKGDLKIGEQPFNYNTLEPVLTKENGLVAMNSILGTKYKDLEQLHVHMRSNKTECALKIFQTDKLVKFPAYILKSIEG